MLKDHTATWESCLRVIKDNISLQAYKVWFEPIIPLKLENDILTIQVPSHFFYEWLEQHYIGLLSKVIKKEVGAEGVEIENAFENQLEIINKFSICESRFLVITSFAVFSKKFFL